MNKIIVTGISGRTVCMLEENGKACEFRLPEEESEILGNIYIGKIKNIVKNISAAFVEIEPGLPCYLELKEGSPLLFTKKGKSKKPEQGDEVLVQVNKEPLKMKAPSLTGELNLPGEFLVLLYGSRSVKASTRLESEKRKELIALGNRLLEEIPEELNVGILFRTNAGVAKLEAVEAEFSGLFETMKGILTTAKYRTCYSCLYKKSAGIGKTLQDFYIDRVDEIVTDDPRTFEEIQSFVENGAFFKKPEVRFYEDPVLPLYRTFSMEKKIKEALSERVWLKSGGFLIIQYTEALSVVDVNTGKYTGNGDKQKTIRKINREAATELARQLRLRNLSGIIVVDFINEEDKEEQKALMDYLQECLNRDPQRAFVVDMTKLGLVEITRKKARQPFFVQWGNRTLNEGSEHE